MKILHIIRSVNPEGGGPIEGVKQLATLIKSKGYEIEVLCLDSPEDAWVQNFPLTVHAKGPGRGKYGYNPSLASWLEANSSDFDNFVINGIWQYHSLAAHQVLRKQDKPYQVFTHGMLDPWFKRQYPLKHLKKCLYWLWGEYPVIRDAQHVLFTSEDEKILARQSFKPYRCHETVINYGTAGHVGDIKEQRKLFLDKFPQLKGKRFLLFLSRIHPKKGIDLLFEAFAKINKEHPDLHLAIAGPDQVGWQKDLHQLAENLGIAHKIFWPGMLSGDIKWGAYHSADAFILPSHQENFGIVVAEALSCSLPVLTSNKVNIWREIDNDNAGLIAADTVDGCLDLITRWLKLDGAKQSAMRKNARDSFTNRFEVSKFALSYLDIVAKHQA